CSACILLHIHTHTHIHTHKHTNTHTHAHTHTICAFFAHTSVSVLCLSSLFSSVCLCPACSSPPFKPHRFPFFFPFFFPSLPPPFCISIPVSPSSRASPDGQERR